MDGSGPGVCAVRTSWQVQTQANGSSPINEESSITIVSVPSTGGIPVKCNISADILIMDITGRRITDLIMTDGEESFIQLPSGIYCLVDKSTGFILQRAVVLD